MHFRASRLLCGATKRLRRPAPSWPWSSPLWRTICICCRLRPRRSIRWVRAFRSSGFPAGRAFFPRHLPPRHFCPHLFITRSLTAGQPELKGADPISHSDLLHPVLLSAGSSAMFYLAAAVSDFYVPVSEMPEHKIQSSRGPLQVMGASLPEIRSPIISLGLISS